MTAVAEWAVGHTAVHIAAVGCIDSVVDSRTVHGVEE